MMSSYEALEWLGDAYLQLISSRLIHSRFPDHSVGQKSGLRELLVRNSTLANYSKDYGFAERIKMVGSPMDLDPKTWTKILGDVFEAYVAAIIESDPTNGYSIVEKWLIQLWAPHIYDWSTNGEGKFTGTQEHATKDMALELQRWLVSPGARIDYLEEKPMKYDKTSGRHTFYIAAYLTGWGYKRHKLGSGNGRNKSIAKSEAAKDAFTSSKDVVFECHQKKLEHDKTKRQQLE
jgi:ribonuclease-3